MEIRLINQFRKLNIKQKLILAIILFQLLYFFSYAVVVEDHSNFIVFIEGKPYTDYSPTPIFFPFPILPWDGTRVKCYCALSPIDEFIYSTVVSSNLYWIMLVFSGIVFFYVYHKLLTHKKQKALPEQ